jgi:predicted O-linked N-acetylglucosamine transferase (SPINDLY family)
VLGSCLVLKGKALADESVAKRFCERFAAHGIGRERLEFLSHTPSTREHLEAYGRVDVALDPFPYAGTTTTCEALWMGVPVVTLAGGRHASRVGVSLLTTLGLSEIIAADPDRYLAIAAGLASDPARLAALRSTLRPRLRASALCDVASFVPKLEAAYREMWRGWCSPGGGRGSGTPG